MTLDAKPLHTLSFYTITVLYSTMAKGAVWHKNLEHQGIQISFDGKPSEEIRKKLKSNGFRWSGRQKIWYARGYNAQVIADQLADYGGEIGEPLSFAEKIERKVEKAEARSKRFDAMATKAESNSQQLYGEASKMADIIPLGQPILVGHYSEGRDRRYRNRIQSKFEKSFEEGKKAEHFKNRAEASADFKERTFDLGTTLRRIEKLETQIRRIKARSDWHIDNADTDKLMFERCLQDKRYRLISKEELEYDEKIIAPLQEEVDYWKEIIRQHEADGKKVWKRDDFQVGEEIIVGGVKAKVRRTNLKTLTIEYIEPGKEWMNMFGQKVPYNELSQTCKG